MTRDLHIMGLLGMGLIWVAFGLAILREDNRQAEALTAQRETAIIAAAELYAENCAACHGASGEGLAANPPLNSDGLREMDELTLFNTVSRGRYDTNMAAFGVDEGGILTTQEIDNLLTLIQFGSWAYVGDVVAEMGLIPPEVIVMEVSEETLNSLSTLPDSDNLGLGLTLYADNCAACHGANLEGSTLAPALSPPSQNYDDMTRIIQQGVTGTLMASWERTLTAEDINALLTLITRWEEIQASGVEMPVIETPPIDLSPAAIAEGQRLFGLLCTQCHGASGYGTALAPALNNQTFLSQTPDAAIQQIIAGGVSGTTMPAWSGYLSEADIAAITAYLRSWEATAPPMAVQ